MNDNNSNNSNQNKTIKKEKKKPKNYIIAEAEQFAKNYTNERIRKQIAENSVLFKDVVRLQLFGAVMIIISFVRAFLDLYPDITVTLWLSQVSKHHIAGLIIEILVQFLTSPAIQDADSFSMIKHIWPSCSGRRYTAKEIDSLANDPDTIWLRELEVFASPSALIGINKGITVVDYDDIAGIYIKKKYHSESITKHKHAKRRPWLALQYALTNYYMEWDTCYIMIKTNSHKRMILTETSYDGYKELMPILIEKCNHVETILYRK